MPPSPPASTASLRAAGLLLILVGVLVRPEVIGANLTPDGVLSGTNKILAIALCEAAACLVGLWLLVRPPRVGSARLVRAANALLALVVALAAFGNVREPRTHGLDGPSLRKKATQRGLASLFSSGSSVTEEMRREAAAHGLNAPELVRDALRLPITSPQRADLEAAVWAEECFAMELTGDQLFVLRRLFSGDLGPEDLGRVFTADARVAPPEIPAGAPETLSLDVTQGRWTPDGGGAALAPDAWWPALEAWLGGFARLRWATFLPKDVRYEDGVAHVEIEWQVNVELASGGLRHDRGTWESEWVLAEGEPEPRPVSSLGWRCRSLWPKAGVTLESESVAFVDVSGEALAGTAMSPLLPRAPEDKEHYRGIALVDVDGDEDLDIVTSLPNTLLLNDGEGRFEDVTEAAGIAREMGFTGLQAADFDRDGDVDLVFTGRRQQSLLYEQVEPGRFEGARIAASGRDNHPASITAHDVDRDGWLDLLICGYGPLVNPGPDRPYDATNARYNQMLRGGPDGFTDVTEAWGLRGESSRWAFIGSFGDADEDGDEDLYMANDFGPNVLYRRVQESPPLFEPEIEPLEDHAASFSMSATWADLDGDLDLDMYVSNMESVEVNRIMRLPGNVEGDERDKRLREVMGNGNAVMLQEEQGGTRELVETSTSRGARDAKWAWGTALFDWDLDGDLDIQCVNGFRSIGLDDGRDWDSVWWRYAAGDMQRHPDLWRESMARHFPANAVKGWSWDGFQRSVFYLNDGAARFEQIAPVLGLDQVCDGRALAMGDLDRDGDLDLVGGSVNAPHLYVLRNDTRGGGHFAFVELVPSENRSAVGAQIRITAGGRTQRRDVALSEGFVTQHEAARHFGLPGATRIERIEVVWPDGEREAWEDLPVDRRLRLRQGEPAAEEVPLRPRNFNATGRLGEVEWANEPWPIELVNAPIEIPVGAAVTPSPLVGLDGDEALRAVVLWDPDDERSRGKVGDLAGLVGIPGLEVVLVTPAGAEPPALPAELPLTHATWTGEEERRALMDALVLWCGVQDPPWPVVLYCTDAGVHAVSRGEIRPERVRALCELR